MKASAAAPAFGVARPRLVREPDPARPERLERRTRLRSVEVLPAVRDVARDDYEPVVRVDEHRLVAGRVTRRRDDANSRNDLRLAVELDVVGTLELDPLRNRVIGFAGRLALPALHVDRKAWKEPIPAAVVEVEVRVDHARDVAWDPLRVDRRAPLLVELRRRVDHPRVDEHATVRVLDHVQVPRPGLALDEPVRHVERTHVSAP